MGAPYRPRSARRRTPRQAGGNGFLGGNSRGWGPQPPSAGGETGALVGEGEEPLDAGCAKGAGALRWVEKLPRCALGCGFGAANSPASSSAEEQLGLPGQTGAAGSIPGGCAWSSVIRTFLSASLHLRLRLIPLFGINIRDGFSRDASASRPRLRWPGGQGCEVRSRQGRGSPQVLLGTRMPVSTLSQVFAKGTAGRGLGSPPGLGHLFSPESH